MSSLLLIRVIDPDLLDALHLERFDKACVYTEDSLKDLTLALDLLSLYGEPRLALGHHVVSFSFNAVSMGFHYLWLGQMAKSSGLTF